MALPTKLYLSTIAAGIGGYRINPETPGDLATTIGDPNGTPWVSGIGDLNGDGIPDIIIGSPGSDDKAVDAGRIFVAMGSATGVPAVSLGDTLSQIIADGIAAGDMAGSSVASSADMNGDLVPELLIGAPLMNRAALTDAGAGFVVWGVPGAGGVDLGDPASAGGKGFVMRGEAAGDRAGSTMASIADLNADGRPDVLVGATGSDAGGLDSGAAYMVFGRSLISPVNLTSVTAGTGGFRIAGQAAGDAAGSALTSIADMNGDGKAEILVGAPGNDAGGADAGAVYVVFGKSTTAAVSLGTVAAGTGGFRITGAGAGDRAGAAVVGVGDVNGDTLPDILVGSPGGDRADIVFGKATTTEVNLAALGAGGYTIIAENAGDLTDLAVAGGGDYNGDGINDLIIGASHNSEGGFDAGAVYLVWGGGSSTVDLSLVAAGFGGTKIVGDAGSLTGSTVAMQGDMNGDGVPELIIGSPGGAEFVSVVYADASWGPDLNVYGTNGDDVIGAGYGGFHVVGEGADSISALAGNDQVTAGGGNDSIDGADGLDTLDGGAGNDTLLGGAGGDSLLGGAGADQLDGGDGSDTMTGGTGDDTYVVAQAGDTVTEAAGEGNDTVIASINWTISAGADIEALVLTGAATSGIGNEFANTITAGSGNATLDGAAGNDTLLGGTGADSLVGGTGADSLAGGAGNDSYVVDNPGDVTTESAGAGNDIVFAGIDWTLGANIEALILTGTAVSATGSADANRLTGNALGNTLDGGDGNDTIDGAAGADTMTGGAGDDVFFVDNIGDVVNEGLLGGNDTVFASADWVMADNNNIESIVLTGTGAHNITGNTSNNGLVGSTGNDTLDGGGGDDTLVGGEGDDRLISGAGIDILAGGGGNDRYVVHGGRAHIEDLLGHDTLDASEATGDSYIDLTGDTLSHIENEDCEIGQGGSTVLPLDVQFLQDLTGSFTDDIATVRSVVPGIVSALQAVQADSKFGASTFRDKAIGSFGSPGDWVYQMAMPLGTSASALTATYGGMSTGGGNDLPEAQIEALMQLGLHAADVGFRSGSAHFVILFTDASYHVAGDGAAAGILTPNNGDAIMNGTPAGTGEDYPIIGQVRAAIEAANIIPIFAIAGGFESVYQTLVTDLGRGTVVTLTSNSSNVVAAITAGLNAVTVTHIEDADGGAGNDVLKGSAGDNVLTGNAGNDSLDGAAGADSLDGGTGNDTLNGGAGIDTMAGGAGADTYLVDNSADTIIELAGIEIDIVRATASFVLPTGVERLYLDGVDNIDGAGNAAANLIWGNAGANLLEGGDGNDNMRGGQGNDTLVGGPGIDNLTGGTGMDHFRFLAAGDGRDKIMDFTVVNDTLDFSALGFGGGLTEGMNVGAAGKFVLGGKATLPTGQFLYNQPTGLLMWDADGTGPGARIQIAMFTGNPALTAADFLIVH